MIKSLLQEIQSPAFMVADENVKNLFYQTLQQYQQIQADQEAKELELAKKRIPTGGYLVDTKMRVPDPNSKTGATKNVKLPYEALNWLLERLDLQGQTQDKLAGVDMATKQAISEMAGQMAGNNPPQAPQGGQPPQM